MKGGLRARAALGALRAAAALVVVVAAGPASAHEARPGYLELRETAAGRYDVLWKHPAQSEYRLKLDPVFPEACKLAGPGSEEAIPGAILTRFTLACDGGLAGKEITIAGLEATPTDVLVRVHRRGWGRSTTASRTSRSRWRI